MMKLVTITLQACRGHCGYPVTHFWRHVGEIAIFFQVAFSQYLTFLDKSEKSSQPVRKHVTDINYSDKRVPRPCQARVEESIWTEKSKKVQSSFHTQFLFNLFAHSKTQSMHRFNRLISEKCVECRNDSIMVVTKTVKVPGGKRRIAEGRRVASKKGRYTEVGFCSFATFYQSCPNLVRYKEACCCRPCFCLCCVSQGEVLCWNFESL